jgi:polyvinyl alcohol dehydrogenase (cytochrome)
MPGKPVVRSVLSAFAFTSVTFASFATAADWPTFGQNISNTASTTQSGITTQNVASLQPKWTYVTQGDVSARAVVADGIAYFPDWGGALHAVNTKDGTKKWSVDLASYFGSPAGSIHARTTPAVDKGIVYVGMQENGYLIAVSAGNGKLVWKTRLEAINFVPLITASPVVYKGLVYTGVASNQEPFAAVIPGYPCCDARGSVVAVDTKTGAVVWQTYTTPPGYSGAGVWGSNFVVDPSRKTLYVSTGNNYSESVDPTYVACIGNGGTKATCASPANHVDSILALDLATGQIKWASKQVTWGQFYAADGSDDWNVDCFFFANGNCPANSGPDYDFASAPNLITYQTANGSKTILGAGQKSGIYFALDPDTGAKLWQTQVGPGSSLGGMEWGSATDGKRIYVSIANLYAIPYFTNPGLGSAGSWAALDPATGQILWQTADPYGAIALGPVSVADGVVYVSSMSGNASAATMLALDAATGGILWGYAPGSSVNAGATIVDGVVYWGSGYAHLGIPGYTGNNKFYAFSVNGK